jgi:hypothetical protein
VVYETREQAAEAARAQWAGTDVQWRLMSIPAEDEPTCEGYGPGGAE